MSNVPNFCILGASGWVGQYLVRSLRAKHPRAAIYAFYRNESPHGDGVEWLRFSSAAQVRELPPATLIHLGRGETEADFEVHQELIGIQNATGLRYLYASSFNAVDADISRSHREEDPPGSQSDYGKFKARCERELEKSSRRFVAFRFAGTHGWAPNRRARTQEFLEKVSRGEAVQVKPGILQNRSFVGDLAEQITLLAGEERAEGVFHLGTHDFSDEVDFLRKLGAAFGYEASCVETVTPTVCNAVMELRRLPQLFPQYRIPSEADTLSRVAAQPELAEYRKR